MTISNPLHYGMEYMDQIEIKAISNIKIYDVNRHQGDFVVKSSSNFQIRLHYDSIM